MTCDRNKLHPITVTNYQSPIFFFPSFPLDMIGGCWQRVYRHSCVLVGGGVPCSLTAVWRLPGFACEEKLAVEKSRPRLLMYPGRFGNSGWNISDGRLQGKEEMGVSDWGKRWLNFPLVFLRGERTLNHRNSLDWFTLKRGSLRFLNIELG